MLIDSLMEKNNRNKKRHGPRAMPFLLSGYKSFEVFAEIG
jgi:hypothetical protein